jgi:hypothetical protein
MGNSSTRIGSCSISSIRESNPVDDDVLLSEDLKEVSAAVVKQTQIKSEVILRRTDAEVA